jgi:hypothetical protein
MTVAMKAAVAAARYPTGMARTSILYHRLLTGPPHPPSPTRSEAGKNNFNEEITPPHPHWERRAILPNHIKFRTFSALAPMRTPPINEVLNYRRGPSSYIIPYSEAYTGTGM